MMQRPASVIVFGVLNIAFGILGLFSLPIVFHSILTGFSGTNPYFSDSVVFKIWSIVALVISPLSVIALFASAYGLLKMRDWGRNLAIIYTAVTIVTSLVGLVISWVYITGPMLERFAGDDSGQAAGAWIGAIASVIGTCVGMAHPIFMWYFMTRPRVLAAFAAHNPTAAAPFDANDIPRNDPANPNPFSAPATAELPVWNAEPGDPSSIAETFIPSKNAPALASYYLGLFSLFPCLGFPLGVAAVYFGIQGIRRVRKNPEVRGGVHAWVGTICGALFGLFNFVLLVLTIIAFAAR